MRKVDLIISTDLKAAPLDMQRAHDSIRQRVHAIQILSWVVDLNNNHDGMSTATIDVENGPSIKGSLVLFLDPMFINGVISCRALLEFLGLCWCKHSNQLAEIRKRHSEDDIGIEQFSNASGPLKKATPAEALKFYPGLSADAENAFLVIFKIANKELAHLTHTNIDDLISYDHLMIASKGITALMTNFFYTPLGLEAPVSPISTHSKHGSTLG